MVKLSTDKDYFTKQKCEKMTVVLNSKNVYISIIEINRESIITLLKSFCTCLIVGFLKVVIVHLM